MKAPKQINFDKKYGILIFLGLKTSTIRLEKKAKRDDLVVLTLDEKEFALAKITDIVIHKVSEISEDVAREDGFLSVDALKKALKNYYPDITDETHVYQIKFSLAKILDLSLIEKDLLNLCNIAIKQGNLSANERIILRKVLNEGINNISKDALIKVKETLRNVYSELVS